MTKTIRGKAMAAAAIVTAAIALPLASASTASAETNLGAHWTNSWRECQTLGNEAAQAGLLDGFKCVKRGSFVIMYPR